MIDIPQIVKRFAAYRKSNEMWGSLHVVLEDANIKDGDVEFCRLWAIDHGDSEGAQLAEILLKMSKTQRLKLRSKVDEYDKENP